MDERWKPIPSLRLAGRYEASDQGRIRDAWQDRSIVEPYERDDTLLVYLQGGAGAQYYRVSRLVWETWVGPLSPRWRVLFCDRNWRRCVPENLYVWRPQALPAPEEPYDTNRFWDHVFATAVAPYTWQAHVIPMRAREQEGRWAA